MGKLVSHVSWFKFFTLCPCACKQMTYTALRVLVLQLQINFRKWANLQIQNLLIMSISSDWFRLSFPEFLEKAVLFLLCFDVTVKNSDTSLILLLWQIICSFVWGSENLSFKSDSFIRLCLRSDCSGSSFLWPFSIYWSRVFFHFLKVFLNYNFRYKFHVFVCFII